MRQQGNQNSGEPHLVKAAGGAWKGTEICPTMESLRLVGNQKKLLVVHYLLDRPMRFSELLKLGLDSKTLSRVLKDLESNRLAKREVISTRPFSVRYSLTDMGRDLKQVMDSFRGWYEKWLMRAETRK